MQMPERFYHILWRATLFWLLKITFRRVRSCQQGWSDGEKPKNNLSDHVYQVDDLRDDELSDVHGTTLKFYHDASLYRKIILSYVLQSETWMLVNRVLILVETSEEVHVQVWWKEVPAAEDILEALVKMYKVVPARLERLLVWINIDLDLARKARKLLAL